MDVCLKILSIGIPTLIAFMINVLAIVLVNRKAAFFGEDAVAGVGIALRFYTVAALPVMGLVNGVQSLIGTYVVDRNPARMQNLIKALLKISVSYGAFVTIAFLLFSQPVSALFSDSPQVVAIMSQTVMIYIAMFFMVPVQLITMIFEQSRGNIKMAMYVSFARQGIYLIPRLLVMPGVLGITGIAVSQRISDVISGSTCIYILWREVFSGFEKKQEKYGLT
jgi:Na+-driven multidrug efflux pump